MSRIRTIDARAEFDVLRLCETHLNSDGVYDLGKNHTLECSNELDIKVETGLLSLLFR